MTFIEGFGILNFMLAGVIHHVTSFVHDLLSSCCRVEVSLEGNIWFMYSCTLDPQMFNVNVSHSS